MPPTLAAAMTLCTATAAWAQEAAPPDRAQSLLTVIWLGFEWPGYIIVAMSLASVTIIFHHFWTIRRVTMIPQEEVDAARRLIEGRQFRDCIEYIQKRRSLFADILTVGLRHGRHGFEAMQEAAEERATAWSSRLFRRVEYLNILGNLAPLMGLLGTVLGMMEAFSAMQRAAGAYKPENLAGGISLALVNTFLGLSVAIIALFFFGICRNRVDELTLAAHAAVVDLLEYFRPAAKAAAPTTTAAVNGSAVEPRTPSA